MRRPAFQRVLAGSVRTAILADRLGSTMVHDRNTTSSLKAPSSARTRFLWKPAIEPRPNRFGWGAGQHLARGGSHCGWPNRRPCWTCSAAVGSSSAAPAGINPRSETLGHRLGVDDPGSGAQLRLLPGSLRIIIKAWTEPSFSLSRPFLHHPPTWTKCTTSRRSPTHQSTRRRPAG